jgi:hypothetical protein
MALLPYVPDPDKWRDVMTLSFIEHRIKELVAVES